VLALCVQFGDDIIHVDCVLHLGLTALSMMGHQLT
jgi:hypothetical protein